MFFTIKMTALCIVSFVFMGLCIINPQESLSGAKDGLLLCGNVIIPSLFPFCVIALFTFKSGIINFISKILDGVTRKFFHLSGEEFCVFLMSFLAGYPVGMRLINELNSADKITKEQGARMALYCVNAGPAFIIIAVGEGILRSRELGIILFLSNLFATLILAFLCERRHSPPPQIENLEKAYISDAFVQSVADAAASIFSVCGWVLLFSALLGALEFDGVFRDVIYAFCEVTNGVIFCKKNLLLISAILSFGGFSVHCQIYSVGKSCAPKYIKFLVFRIFHTLLSLAFLYLILSVKGISVTTFSNGITPIRQNLSFSLAGAISLFLMSLFLILTTQFEKRNKLL